MRLAISIAVSLVVLLVVSIGVSGQQDDRIWWYELQSGEPAVGRAGVGWHGEFSVTAQDGQNIRFPPEGSYVIAFVPPPDTRAITVSHVIRYRQTVVGNAGSLIYQRFHPGSTFQTVEQPVNVELGSPVTVNSNVGQGSAERDNTVTQILRWRLKNQYSAWPGSVVVEYGSYSDYSVSRFFADLVTVGLGSVATVDVEIEMMVLDIERMDGSHWVPEDDEVFEITPWGPIAYGTPISWYATPEAPNVGITPIMTGCYTLLPSFSTDAVTKYGVPIPDISWDAVEICTVQHSFDYEWLGINFGVVIVTMTLIGGFGIIYSRLR